MVLRPEIIFHRLKELDTVLQELVKYRDKNVEDLSSSLSLRWIIERGLIAAANIIFDVSDHILSAKFAFYSETYEDSLAGLKDKGIISDDIYLKIKGFGGFRNILVHQYLGIDLKELHKNFMKSFEVLPRFSLEIQKWLKQEQPSGNSEKNLGEENCERKCSFFAYQIRKNREKYWWDA